MAAAAMAATGTRAHGEPPEPPGPDEPARRALYFCGSIRGGRDDLALYGRIVARLRRFGAVLTEHVAAAELSARGEAAGRGGEGRARPCPRSWRSLGPEPALPGLVLPTGGAPLPEDEVLQARTFVAPSRPTPTFGATLANSGWPVPACTSLLLLCPRAEEAEPDQPLLWPHCYCDLRLMLPFFIF